MKQRIFQIVFTVFLILPAVFFLFTGFSWLVSPETAAENLLMPLLRGSGMGSQVSDIGGMFMAIGITVMSAVVWRKFEWLRPVSILLGCIAIYRLFTFALFGVVFAVPMLLFEILLAAWFGLASGKLSQKVYPHA